MLQSTFFATLELFLTPGWWSSLKSVFHILDVNLLVLSGWNEQPTEVVNFQQMRVAKVLILSDDKFVVQRWLHGEALRGPTYLSPFDDVPRYIEEDLSWSKSMSLGENRLSGLPAEIRVTIYELLLVQAQEIRPLDHYDGLEDDMYDSSRFKNHVLRDRIRFLGVCRLIHNEGTSILYGSNVFRLISREAGDTTNWLTTIGIRNRSRLRYLRIDPDQVLRASNGLRFPSINQVSTEFPRRPMGQSMQIAMAALVNKMQQEFADIINEAYNAAKDGFLQSLELLQDCLQISRLEIRLPLDCRLDDDDYDCSFQSLEPLVATCSSTLRILRAIRVANELRIGTDDITKELEDTVRKVGVAETIVFPDSPYASGETCFLDENCDASWELRTCTNQARFTLRPRTMNRTEERIQHIWPQFHGKFCSIGAEEDDRRSCIGSLNDGLAD